jgi:hypothetical protein
LIFVVLHGAEGKSPPPLLSELTINCSTHGGDIVIGRATYTFATSSALADRIDGTRKGAGGKQKEKILLMGQSKHCFNTELVGCCLTLNVSSRLLFNVKRVKNVLKTCLLKTC